jgi:hypothetical protein
MNTVFSLLDHEGIVGLIPAGRSPLFVQDACDIRSDHAKQTGRNSPQMLVRQEAAKDVPQSSEHDVSF